MDAGIADTINRRAAEQIALHLDHIDAECRREMLLPADLGPWYRAPIADTLMGVGRDTDRAWLVGQLAARTPGIAFDGTPADCDWDNFYSHLRAEVETRRERDPQAPPVRAQPLCEMV